MPKAILIGINFLTLTSWSFYTSLELSKAIPSLKLNSNLNLDSSVYNN